MALYVQNSHYKCGVLYCIMIDIVLEEEFCISPNEFVSKENTRSDAAEDRWIRIICLTAWLQVHAASRIAVGRRRDQYLLKQLYREEAPL